MFINQKKKFSPKSSLTLVCYTAVFSVVTQRSSPQTLDETSGANTFQKMGTEF